MTSVATMPAGPDLDAIVAERVLGIPPGCTEIKRRTSGGAVHTFTLPGEPVPYSTELDRAWELVERLGIGVLPDHDQQPGDIRRWLAGSNPAWWQSSVSWVEASLYEQPGPGRPWAIGETPALAICRAALAAVVSDP